MRNIWLVGAREFKTRIRQRSFLFTTLLLPIIILLGAGAGNISAGSEPGPSEVNSPDKWGSQGLVDMAGIIQDYPERVAEEYFKIFASEPEAKAALERGDIESYYIVPETYLEHGQIDYISQSLPNSPPENDALQWLLVWNLAKSRGFSNPQLLRNPAGSSGLAYVNLSSETSQGADSMAPMFASIIILVPLFVNGGLIFQSLTKEKESRVMELLLASLRPRDLLAGKLLGVSALMLIQYAIWGGLAAAGLILFRAQLSQLISGLSYSRVELVLVLAYAVGGFFLYAGLMAGIGALAPDSESSRAWLLVVTLPMTIPIYLGSAIASDPQGALSVALSLFPPSAPVAMLMRMAGSSVPGWQIGVSLAAVVLAVIVVLFVMSRLFRAQTLLSGEPLSLGRFWRTLRSA
jgi:ABC-2 type transport system permease protein